ncbi:MAG: hypothetical protein WC707_02395 [Candidatus Babeliaceae bacterium]|jgi:hypothetical protein
MLYKKRKYILLLVYFCFSWQELRNMQAAPLVISALPQITRVIIAALAYYKLHNTPTQYPLHAQQTTHPSINPSCSAAPTLTKTPEICFNTAVNNSSKTAPAPSYNPQTILGGLVSSINFSSHINNPHPTHARMGTPYYARVNINTVDAYEHNQLRINQQQTRIIRLYKSAGQLDYLQQQAIDICNNLLLLTSSSVDGIQARLALPHLRLILPIDDNNLHDAQEKIAYFACHKDGSLRAQLSDKQAYYIARAIIKFVETTYGKQAADYYLNQAIAHTIPGFDYVAHPQKYTNTLRKKISHMTHVIAPRRRIYQDIIRNAFNQDLQQIIQLCAEQNFTAAHAHVQKYSKNQPHQFNVAQSIYRYHAPQALTAGGDPKNHKSNAFYNKEIEHENQKRFSIIKRYAQFPDTTILDGLDDESITLAQTLQKYYSQALQEDNKEKQQEIESILDTLQEIVHGFSDEIAQQGISAIQNLPQNMAAGCVLNAVATVIAPQFSVIARIAVNSGIMLSHGKNFIEDIIMLGYAAINHQPYQVGRALAYATIDGGETLRAFNGLHTLKKAHYSDNSGHKNGGSSKPKSQNTNPTTIQWTNHKHKHSPQKNLNWKEIVQYTKYGDAKYKHEVNIEATERFAWEKGVTVNNGKTWKVMKFDHTIGAKNGIETPYMRVEISANTIHGHPITPAEYKDLTK